MSTPVVFTLLLIASFFPTSEPACARVCDLAIGSYYVSPALNLTHISSLFGISSDDEILRYNPAIVDRSSLSPGSRINVSVPCNCTGDDFLGHTFTYAAVGNETYDRIAAEYAGLTTSDLLQKVNSYPPTGIPDGGRVNVTVTCFCGDRSVSVDYGLFVTYPLRGGDSLKSLAEGYGFSGKEDLLQRYNPGMNFSAGEGVVFIPTKGEVSVQLYRLPLIAYV